MHFLRKLLQRNVDRVTGLVRPDGPEPVYVPLEASEANPILRLLDDWQLPFHETRAEVIVRVDVTLDPLYQTDALMLPEAVSLPGAMQPWSASAFQRIPPQFPISRFSSLVWLEDDAHENLRRTAHLVAEALGPAPIGRHWNTLTACWRSGMTEISLIAWPPEWQSHLPPNPAQERQPRLRTACHVNVATGFCPPLSEQERHWLESFRPIRLEDGVEAVKPSYIDSVAPFETAMEYARESEGIGLERGSLGMSADGNALIVFSSHLYVMPRTAIIRLEVIRLTPAKGAGGSILYAHCKTRAPGADTYSVTLAQSSETDGLNAFAKTLGTALGCSVEIGPAFPDC